MLNIQTRIQSYTDNINIRTLKSFSVKMLKLCTMLLTCHVAFETF